MAPGHQSLKHVFPTGGTHVAPSRNRTIVIGGRHVFLISKKGLLFALWVPAFAGMTECGRYGIHISNLFVTTATVRHAVEERHPSDKSPKIGRKHIEVGGKMEKKPAVYILASMKNGTLYTGVTSGLLKRVWQHKNGIIEGFTKRYHVNMLVWFELHLTMESAIQREKQIKKWKRDWKVKMIEEKNPEWDDLYFRYSNGSRPPPE